MFSLGVMFLSFMNDWVLKEHLISYIEVYINTLFFVSVEQ